MAAMSLFASYARVLGALAPARTASASLGCPAAAMRSPLSAFAARRFYSDDLETEPVENDTLESPSATSANKKASTVRRKFRTTDPTADLLPFGKLLQVKTAPESLLSFKDLDNIVRKDGKFAVSHENSAEASGFKPKIFRKMKNTISSNTTSNDAQTDEKDNEAHALRSNKDSIPMSPVSVARAEARLVDNLTLGRSYMAWRNFYILSKVRPEALTEETCINLARLFYKESRVSQNHNKINFIYTFMQRQNMNLPLDMYCSLLDFSYYQPVHVVEKYYAAALQKFGVESLTSDMNISLLRVYNRNLKHEKTIEHYNLLANANLPFNIARLKPLLMEAYFLMGNEQRALELFYEYLSNETRIINVASVYSRLAALYCRTGRIADGEAVLMSYKERGYPYVLRVSSVWARIHIERGNLEAAYDELVEKLKTKRNMSSKGEEIMFLTRCFRSDKEDLAVKFIEKYNMYMVDARTPQFRPIVLAMDYLSFKHRNMEQIERLFSMWPKDRAYTHMSLLRVKLFCYLRAGDIEGAKKFVEDVVGNGSIFFNRFIEVEKFVEDSNRKSIAIKYALSEIDNIKLESLNTSDILNTSSSSNYFGETSTETPKSALNTN